MAKIPASILRIGVEGETLLEALPRMRDAYCSTIAYQIEHLSSHQQRMWLREMIETGWRRAPLSEEEKRSLLSRLSDVHGFERFLQKAYLGQKMFSIEGLDVTVPMLDEIATLARQNGAEEVVLGMAHRGRLSVLAHNLGRSVESILAEFEGAKALDQVKAIAHIPHSGTGDVKYHHGAEGLFTTRDDEEVKIRLYPNPSHLEFVDPVVTGGGRAAQTEHTGPTLKHNPHVAVPVLLHGDAAFPAQGVVAETLNLQALPATRPAARSTSSPTTRLASPPIPPRVARPPMPVTWRRASTCRSSMSMPTTWRPASRRPGWRWPTASSGAATSSST